MKKLFWIVLLLSLCAGPALAQDVGKGNPTVVIKTSKGEIEAVLFRDKAPVTVDNFMKYVDSAFYTGTIFHRVISGFMIQGGGFDRYFTKKPTRPPIKNEAANGLKNERGTLAMARTPRWIRPPPSSSSTSMITRPSTTVSATMDTRSSARSPGAWTWSTPSPVHGPGRKARSIRTYPAKR